MKIAISIADYVGIVGRVLFSKYCEALALGKNLEGILMPNSRLSPIEDANFEGRLANITLNFRDTFDKGGVYKGAHYVNIATPNNCDPEDNYFSGPLFRLLCRMS